VFKNKEYDINSVTYFLYKLKWKVILFINESRIIFASFIYLHNLTKSFSG
jgi:hypothetical protein